MRVKPLPPEKVLSSKLHLSERALEGWSEGPFWLLSRSPGDVDAALCDERTASDIRMSVMLLHGSQIVTMMAREAVKAKFPIVISVAELRNYLFLESTLFR